MFALPAMGAPPPVAPGTRSLRQTRVRVQRGIARIADDQVLGCVWFGHLGWTLGVKSEDLQYLAINETVPSAASSPCRILRRDMTGSALASTPTRVEAHYAPITTH
jgi:hypothetical protein